MDERRTAFSQRVRRLFGVDESRSRLFQLTIVRLTILGFAARLGRSMVEQVVAAHRVVHVEERAALLDVTDSQVLLGAGVYNTIPSKLVTARAVDAMDLCT